MCDLGAVQKCAKMSRSKKIHARQKKSCNIGLGTAEDGLSDASYRLNNLGVPEWQYLVKSCKYM